MGNMTDYLDFYTTNIISALSRVDTQKVEEACDLIRSNLYAPVFVFGNGGSAAIAEHFTVDYNKGIWQDTKINTRAISLVSNVSLLTALANDTNYAFVFSKQIDSYNPNGNGLAIAISSSGNSPNILNGLEAAKRNNIKSIALVGFDGGNVKSNNLADVIIHVKKYNYGIVEDTHMVILHSIIQKLRLEYSLVGEPKL